MGSGKGKEHAVLRDSWHADTGGGSLVRDLRPAARRRLRRCRHWNSPEPKKHGGSFWDYSGNKLATAVQFVHSLPARLLGPN